MSKLSPLPNATMKVNNSSFLKPSFPLGHKILPSFTHAPIRELFFPLSGAGGIKSPPLHTHLAKKHIVISPILKQKHFLLISVSLVSNHHFLFGLILFTPNLPKLFPYAQVSKSPHFQISSIRLTHSPPNEVLESMSPLTGACFMGTTR